MTASELAAYVGQVGALRTAEGLSVTVEITDAREMFGRVDLLVSPKAGRNSAWVDAKRVYLGDAEPVHTDPDGGTVLESR